LNVDNINGTETNTPLIAAPKGGMMATNLCKHELPVPACLECRPVAPTQPPALSDGQIDRMVGTQFMCRTVILDRLEWLDISAQAKRANALAAEVERLEQDKYDALRNLGARVKELQSAERQRDAAVGALEESIAIGKELDGKDNSCDPTSDDDWKRLEAALQEVK
jgi:hypothetical protein